MIRSVSTVLTSLLLGLCLLVPSTEANAQERPDVLSETGPSAGKAFGMSLLLPGLGHKYVNDGHWSNWAITYASTDASLWLGLIGGEWHRNHLVDSYTTLAQSAAGAQVSGKDRTFFLNLASFESSDVFRETMLRNRSWDLVGYVDDPSFHWQWQTTEDYSHYRDLRDDSETLRRRRSILIAALVANRLISGAISARSAGRTRRMVVSASFGAPVETIPTLSLRARF